jgi:hypothetical protein
MIHVSFKNYMFWPVKNRFIHCYKFLAFKYFFGFWTPFGTKVVGTTLIARWHTKIRSLEVHDIILVLKSFIGDFFLFLAFSPWHANFYQLPDEWMLISSVGIPNCMCVACPSCCRALCARYKDFLSLKFN